MSRKRTLTSFFSFSWLRSAGSFSASFNTDWGTKGEMSLSILLILTFSSVISQWFLACSTTLRAVFAKSSIRKKSLGVKRVPGFPTTLTTSSTSSPMNAGTAASGPTRTIEPSCLSMGSLSGTTTIRRFSRAFLMTGRLLLHDRQFTGRS